MDNQIIVNDYRQMDKILKDERQYLLNMCKKIKKTGCNVLFIQKSILRDAVNDLSLHFLSKLKILVVKEIERDEIEFICKVFFIFHYSKLLFFFYFIFIFRYLILQNYLKLFFLIWIGIVYWM